MSTCAHTLSIGRNPRSLPVFHVAEICRVRQVSLGARSAADHFELWLHQSSPNHTPLIYKAYTQAAHVHIIFITRGQSSPGVSFHYKANIILVCMVLLYNLITTIPTFLYFDFLFCVDLISVRFCCLLYYPQNALWDWDEVVMNQNSSMKLKCYA